jgi:two-component system alkaline phosphatase synthesis response regulator PhoP
MWCTERIFSNVGKRAGRVLGHDITLSDVWGYDCYVGPRSIERFVTTLRNKIEPEPHNPIFIHTIREIGYKFELLE